MERTQVRNSDIYNGAIDDIKVNNSADIRGTKIREGTIAERGTVRFADDGDTDELEAVQGNDSRLHYQNTDTGTTADIFTLNMDQADLGSTTLVWSVTEPTLDLGAALRYSLSLEGVDIVGAFEYCLNYNAGVQVWKRFYCLNPDDVEEVTGDWTISGDWVFEGDMTFNGELNATSRLLVPAWTDATRPAVPAQREIGFNTDTNQFEAYNGTEWILLG